MQQISAPKSTEKAFAKLLDKMYISNVSKRLRELNQPNDIDRKRWIWELLQNAKDTIANNRTRNSIKARIVIDGNTVKFQHDGDPFTADARLGLLYKYSEDKENAESTGRFGTGFLTTHCLSKIVSIESNMFGDEEAIIGFSVTMYRDGFTEQELIEGLYKMRESELYFDQPYEWTTYTYQVNSESGRRAIQLGKENFKENITQTLLFCKELASVELIDNGERTYIERLSDCSLSDKIHQVQFNIISGNTFHVTRTFIYSSIEEADEELSAKYKAERSIRLQVACEVDESKNIISTDEKTSLFCVFPLVGIEGQMQMPLFVNSPDFEPDSERQSLILNGDTKDEEKGVITEVGINQKILCKLPDMFKLLVEYLSDNAYCNFYNLCNGLKSVKDNEKLDKTWFKENVVSALRSVLMSYPIVVPYSTAGTQSLRQLSECIIVKEEKHEDEEDLFNLLVSLYPEKLVSDNSKWSNMLWKDDSIKLWGTENVCKEIESKGSLDALNMNSGNDTLRWYNKFLAFVLSRNELLLKDYALLPNMNGVFLKKDTEDFKQGDGVTSVVLDVLANLGSDMRPLLLHKSITSISLDSKFNSTSYSAKANSLAKQIIETPSSSLSDFTKLMKLKPLISIIISESSKYEQEFVAKRQHIFDITKKLFELQNWQTTTDNSLNKSAWEETDKWLVNYIISTIESKKSLENLPAGLGAKWLNNTIFNLEITLSTLDVKAIVPNQNGTFCFSKDLYIDNGIPEVLKNEVFKKIGISYKDILLDNAIDLKVLGKTNSKNIASFADDLSKATSGSNNNTFNLILSYGLYRKYSEEDLRQVAQYMIQIIPATEFEGVLNTQDSLRRVARFFLVDKCKGVDETIEYTDSKLWQRINEFICIDIATYIEKKATIEALVNDLATTEEVLFENLNVLYRYIETRNISLNRKAFYPNQAGKFVVKDKLSKESEYIDKLLKDIISLIADEGENYYNILIDSRCTATIDKPKNCADTYAYIDGKIKELYDNHAKWEDNNFKKAARLLIDEWGELNRNLFDENHFPKVYRIKDSISMNVVWTKNERQQLQILKNSLNAEDLTNLVSHIDDFKDLRARNRELEDENAKLRKTIKDMQSGKILEVDPDIDIDNGASQEQMFAAQLEAQGKLMEIQPLWKFPENYGKCDEEGKPYNFSTVIIEDENNQQLPIVLKSYKSRAEKFKINPEEWSWVVEKDARLFVYTTVNDELDIVEVSQSDLVMNQPNMSITFSTKNLDKEKYSERVSYFADTLHYFTDLHFNFEQFHIASNVKRVKDIYSKHQGIQSQTTNDDL